MYACIQECHVRLTLSRDVDQQCLNSIYQPVKKTFVLGCHGHVQIALSVNKSTFIIVIIIIDYSIVYQRHVGSKVMQMNQYAKRHCYVIKVSS